MKPFGVGILGTGAIVREAHLPALAGNPRARAVAIGNHRLLLRNRPMIAARIEPACNG